MAETRLFPIEQTVITSDDWYTPQWIFESLNLTFQLDVCSPPSGVPWIPAQKYFSQKDDGLSQDWAGLVWMNPPYSDPLPWVRKFIQHGNGVALVPTSNGKWQDELWDADTYWVTLKAIRFQSLLGLAKSTLPNRCWLVAMGDGAVEALYNSKIGKVKH